MGKYSGLIKDYQYEVRRVLLYTLALNLLVASSKIVYGYMINSIAMFSDGLHSLFDSTSNIIGIVGIWVSSQPPDEKHPYGHRKYETLFTIIIAIMIFSACFQILKKIYLSFTTLHITNVTKASFVIMLITLAVNIFVMVYEKNKGEQLKSEFLIADSMHTKSDIFASIAVISSLIFTKLGYTLADIIIGFVIAILIALTGFKILKQSSDILVDTTCINKEVIKDVVNKIPDVKGCCDIRSRGHENAVYIDLCVLVDKDISMERAHLIADKVEKAIKENIPSVIDIVVHLEPFCPKNTEK